MANIMTKEIPGPETTERRTRYQKRGQLKKPTLTWRLLLTEPIHNGGSRSFLGEGHACKFAKINNQSLTKFTGTCFNQSPNVQNKIYIDVE